MGEENKTEREGESQIYIYLQTTYLVAHVGLIKVLKLKK